jgi:hypothetical protein
VRLGIPILLLLLAVMPYTLYAEATTGIILGNTCITLIKYNLSTTCPTYEEILALFPDSLNTKIAGEFAYRDGYYHRQPGQYGDSFDYYRFTNLDGNYIDPPSSLARRIPTITIMPGDFIYKQKGTVLTDTSYTVGYGRYMEGCSSAIISADEWFWLLGDTVNWMQNGCKPQYTNFNATKTIRWQAVQHDITLSYKYKLDNWFKQAIKECGTKVCIYEKNQAAQPGRAGVKEPVGVSG